MNVINLSGDQKRALLHETITELRYELIAARAVMYDHLSHPRRLRSYTEISLYATALSSDIARFENQFDALSRGDDHT